MECILRGARPDRRLVVGARVRDYRRARWDQLVREYRVERQVARLFRQQRVSAKRCTGSDARVRGVLCGGPCAPPPGVGVAGEGGAARGAGVVFAGAGRGGRPGLVGVAGGGARNPCLGMSRVTGDPKEVSLPCKKEKIPKGKNDRAQKTG